MACSWKCSIKHIYWKANMSADWMATHFNHLSLGFHIFTTPPQELTSVLAADALEIAWPRAI
ncbi:hypothetical protein COLO4_19945 [Corchorus olitorius]|uniref:RNase H type-1 domain-containing protein n=1 Tax=Corchorus olitorius TaxID=93759 RepID=A0A1R3J2M4_9ROSI|nr:hypothetical protein COLO4_19945 [Corchorus olitorius]